MINVKFNIGSKPHEIEFKNTAELGEWIIKNFVFNIIDIKVN